MNTRTTAIPLDIINIKQKLDAGTFAVKLDTSNELWLEDTRACQSVKLMTLPEGYSFHAKGHWIPTFFTFDIVPGGDTEDYEGWECSMCGSPTFEKTDWCTCGADMRNRWRSVLSD